MVAQLCSFRASIECERAPEGLRVVAAGAVRRRRTEPVERFQNNLPTPEGWRNSRTPNVGAESAQCLRSTPVRESGRRSPLTRNASP